jgi:hypothetical protein
MVLVASITADKAVYLERATGWRDLLASWAGSFHVFSTLPLSFDLIALGVEVVERSIHEKDGGYPRNDDATEKQRQHNDGVNLRGSLILNKKSNEDSGSGTGDYKTGEHDQSLHGQSALLRMIGQMVMAMLRRIPNPRRSTMRFMLIGRHENGVGVMIRATTGMGARGNGKCHTDAQHPKR